MNANDIAAIKRLESRDWFAQLAPNLAIERRTDFVGVHHPAKALSDDFPSAVALARFETDGWFRIPNVLPSDTVAAMRDVVIALESVNVPALFAYVYDAFWQCLEVIAPRVAQFTGAVEVLPDIWAWHLARGTPTSGWKAHRGSYAVENGADGKPALTNVWIPLTDVDETNACMWAVPLPRDTNYPHSMSSHAAADAGQGVALPATAGSVVGWNANVLHWGGDMSPTATFHRISFSFTLRAVGARTAHIQRLPQSLDFSARLQLIAEMVNVYQSQAAPLPNYVVTWAKLKQGMVMAGLAHASAKAKT